MLWSICTVYNEISSSKTYVRRLGRFLENLVPISKHVQTLELSSSESIPEKENEMRNKQEKDF